MCHRLKEGAIFVADSHYPHFGDELLELLKAIKQKKITPPQLILMGDIFDLLFGCGEYIKSFSKEAITLLDTLSKELEIIYLEGNHDFYLKPLFPNINIFPRELQPVEFKLNGKRVMLSHGDKFEVGFGYEIYSFLIRHPVVLNILRVAEKFVIDKNINHLKSKKICKEFVGFEKRVAKILKHYPKNTDLVIEGHYHQGQKIGRYISLPSLVCQGGVGVIRGGEVEFVALEDLIKERV